jgi:hypothetical protein
MKFSFGILFLITENKILLSCFILLVSCRNNRQNKTRRMNFDFPEKELICFTKAMFRFVSAKYSSKYSANETKLNCTIYKYIYMYICIAHVRMCEKKVYMFVDFRVDVLVHIHVLVRVHCTCTCMYKYMSVYVQVYVHAAFPCYMSMTHIFAACPCCMSMPHVHVDVHPACPCCMSMLHVLASCLCCMSILHARAARSCRMSMSMLHVHAA